MPVRGNYQKLSNQIREHVITAIVDENKTHSEVAIILGVSRTTISTIISVFRKQNQIHCLPTKSNWKKKLTRGQEKVVVNMVKEQNDIALKTIQQRMISCNDMFFNIHYINLTTINRVLKRNKISMKNLDIIPISRNTPSTIEKRYKYVRECIQNNGECTIFLDEAGFNLHFQRHRGRNIIWHSFFTSITWREHLSDDSTVQQWFVAPSCPTWRLQCPKTYRILRWTKHHC